MYKILTPNQSVLKAYLKESVSLNELQVFRNVMQTLFMRINPSESEEFNKNLVIDFLGQSLYKGNSYMVNTYHRTDLAIYSNVNLHNGHPMVLFEFKGPLRPDMVTINDLKKKSLYELVLYYIREEIQKKNTDVKHLIITNCWEYFIFEKKLFYQLFAKDRRFVQNVLNADTGGDNTDYIYNAIIKPKVEEIESKLQFTYLDLKRFEKNIGNESILDLTDRMKTFFNKGGQDNSKLLGNGKTINISIKEDNTALNLIFLNRSASYNNTFGYYFYKTGTSVDVDQVRKYIIFPNVSFDWYGGQILILESGNKVRLLYFDEDGQAHDTFPAGYTVGWFLYADGFKNGYGNNLC